MGWRTGLSTSANRVKPVEKRFRGGLIWPDLPGDSTRSPHRTGSGRLAGKTTLRQLLVLYTLAEVLVTNDSGPAHFATLTRIRVVMLFGPETPELFAARTSRNTAFLAVKGSGRES